MFFITVLGAMAVVFTITTLIEYAISPEVAKASDWFSNLVIVTYLGSFIYGLCTVGFATGLYYAGLASVGLLAVVLLMMLFGITGVQEEGSAKGAV